MIGRPLRPVRADEVAAYDRDGVVHLPGLFDPVWTRLMADAVDAAIAAPGPHGEDYVAPGGGGRFFGDLDLWRRHAPFRHFVLDSPAGEIAATIMGSSTATFFYDQLLVKEPGTAERTPWHQDQPYWAVDGRQVCSLWVPFDPVPAETSVEFVAGSHRWDRFNPRHFRDGSPYAGTGLPPLPDIEAERARHDIRRFELVPGDCLAFQAMIVHSAPGNASTRHRRRALATRWLGDDARFAIRAGEVAIPTSDPGLAPGARYAGPFYPQVWPRT